MSEKRRSSRKILAVSGGVDSMVMLDVLTTTAKAEKKYASGDISGDDNYACDDIIVAHFDHGMRDNSAEDADFVQKTSEEIYHVANITEKGNLPSNTSEERARGARYDFLRKLMRRNEPAEIYTAHHLDDLIETVAINLLRGTGWRGLAVLDAPYIRRPLLETELFYEPLDKWAIYEYAAKKGLHFREDQSNTSDHYLRNRVRERLTAENWSYERKLELWKLWRRQKELRREIDHLLAGIIPAQGEPWERKWFSELEQPVAQELLRAGLLRIGIRATRPQIEDFRLAILDYAPGKKFNLPGDTLIKFTKTQFWLD